MALRLNISVLIMYSVLSPFCSFSFAIPAWLSFACLQQCFQRFDGRQCRLVSKPICWQLISFAICLFRSCCCFRFGGSLGVER